jgi:hypothetical protein
MMTAREINPTATFQISLSEEKVMQYTAWLSKGMQEVKILLYRPRTEDQLLLVNKKGNRKGQSCRCSCTTRSKDDHGN